MRKSHLIVTFAALCLFLAAQSQAVIVWQVGVDDNAWPVDGLGSGPNADFVQESLIEPAPGNANGINSATADDDYYLPGVYPAPIGVTLGEIAAERAFAGTDNNLRYHSNLPISINPWDLLSVTFDSNNLHGQGGTEHYGVEVYFNGVLVLPEVDVNPGTLDFDFTTPLFTAASVGAQTGAGFDNVVELRGINYSGSGGGNWMGVDYVQLDVTPGTAPVPEPAVMTLGLMAMSALGLRRRRRRDA